jgi:hypothetical protein
MEFNTPLLGRIDPRLKSISRIIGPKLVKLGEKMAG